VEHDVGAIFPIILGQSRLLGLQSLPEVVNLSPFLSQKGMRLQRGGRRQAAGSRQEAEQRRRDPRKK